MEQHSVTPGQAWARVRAILGPERSYFYLAVLYAVAISLLTLTVPLCVQILVGTVANTAQSQQVAVLGIVLFALLGLSGLLVGLQTHLMELFERRFFCRITSEIVMRNIYARFAFFETINREELVNRFFEIMTIQKHVPKLFVGGSALVLQTVVGFVVVSAYHPFLLVLNVALALLIALILRIWGPGAVRSVVSLSQAKYRVAHRLEELARANAFFKGERSIQHAIDVAEQATARYVDDHKAFFRYKFSQIIGLLSLYSLASALLLGLGGWLVIREELTLGQLVAAELILSVVFVGLSRSGEYLDLYYEVCAAAEKLSMFFSIPLEEDSGRVSIEATRADVRFDDVECGERGHEYRMDFQIPAGRSVLIATQSQTSQKLVIDLLQRHRDPEAGRILVAGVDLADCRLHDLRDRVAVLDSSGVLERTVAEYLSLGDPGITRARMQEVLAATRLEDVIDRLPDGLDTSMGAWGYPLSRTETLRLKLAAMLLAEPRVLIITEVFDTVTPDRKAIFEELRGRQDLTVLCFSNRRDLDVFDEYLYLAWEHTYRFDSLEALLAFELRREREAGRVA
jgi:ABC-type bacteriocin/lantibiotic exporter with double-glycine peptidase domain